MRRQIFYLYTSR